jgi:hypothetical protein
MSPENRRRVTASTLAQFQMLKILSERGNPDQSHMDEALPDVHKPKVPEQG